jgi:hypothetical protein
VSGPARNAADLLRPQIEELGSLRNASTRDPRFKQWRQNTLTVIQRIWPGDSSRSERFRRVPFSPPSLKHDVKTGRDYYERGCAEALEYLNLLLAQIEGKEPAPATPAVDPTPEELESLPDDFPTIDLSDGLEGPLGAEPPGLAAEPPPKEASPAAGPPPVPKAAVQAPGPPPAPKPAMRAPGPPPAPKASRPAAVPPPRISVRGKSRSEEGAEAGERVNPLSDILSSVPTPPPAPPERPARAPRGRKGNGKRGLKEMLGLSEMDRAQATPSNPPAGSVAKPPPPTPRIDAAAPRPAAERRDMPARPRPRPGQESADALALPEFSVPAEGAPLAPEDREERFTPPPVPSPPTKPESRPLEAGIEPPKAPETAEYDFEPLAQPDPFDVEPEPLEELEPSDTEPAPLDTEPEPLDVEPEPLEELEPFDAELEPLDDLEPPGAEPEPMEPEPEPAAPETHAKAGAFEPPAGPLPDEELGAGDEDAAARVTEEFVMNSPVLSSQARPVKRPAPPQARQTSPPPAAVQLMQIANNVSALGVPEGQRALARATLMDLSRLIETQEMTWESLRDAMLFVMQFPPLARRTLPLLLLFLDLAA